MRPGCRGARALMLALAALLLTSALSGCAEKRRGTTDFPVLSETARPSVPPSRDRYGRASEAEPPQPVDAASAPPRSPELYPGTGDFVRRRVDRIEVREGGAGFTLNFVDAAIAEVVDAVLGGALGLNYAIDPNVAGTVTARTARPLPRGQVLPALEDILAMNGAAVVQADGLYRVVPLEQAGTAAPALSAEGQVDAAYGIHVIPLEHASADAMQETLQAFIAPGRTLHVDSGRNILLFRGPGSEARDLVEMVRLFDVDWMAGMSFALVPLDSADATEVAEELAEVFGQDGTGPMRGLIRFLPIERMNAVLVMSERPSYLRRAETWIERLDRGIAEGQRQLFVYYVRNARAADLADVLSEIFDVRTAGDVSTRGAEVAPGERAGTAFGTTRGRGFGDTTRGGGAQLGQTLGGGALSGATRTDRADRLADDASQEDGITAGTRRTPGSIGSLSRSRAGRVPDGREARSTDGPGHEDGPRIVADVRNNALLVLATGQEYRMIEQTLKRLDLVPLQVLIEATIAEVRLNDELSYGVRWFFENQSGSASQRATFSDLPSGAVAPSFPGFSYLLEFSDGRVALNALSAVTNVNVISSPQLMVLDNGSARLQVGDQVPVPVQQSVSVADPDAPLVNTIQYVDTGVILEVTPHVNASGLVVLDVRQEVSDVVQTISSGIDAPTIQQREIESAIAVQTGETIALGGLIRDNREDSVSGVPVLMDVPVLGNLFKSNDEIAERTELLILLTPRVVRDQEESREVTRELRRRLKGLDRFRGETDEPDDGVTPPLPSPPTS